MADNIWFLRKLFQLFFPLEVGIELILRWVVQGVKKIIWEIIRWARAKFFSINTLTFTFSNKNGSRTWIISA